MSTITFTIAGAAVSVVYGSWNLTSQIDQQDSCSFTVVDTSGTASFSKGQPVIISDSVLGTLWKGYVNKPKASKLAPNVGRLWMIDCIDQTYLANKRTSNKVYANQYSGTIVADQVQRYLADEGVSGAFALDWDELETDFAAGTLTNVVATTNSHDGNNGDGDLELALAGSDVTWSDGDLSSGGISTLKLVGTAFQGVNNNYIYQKIWEGSITIQSGDHLDYWVWIVGSSPQIMAGVDFVCTDGTSFRDSAGAGTDAQGVLPHPKYDLSGLADDQWYFRSFGVSAPLIGKTLQYISVAFEGDNAGTYIAFFKEVYYYKSGGTTQQIIFDHTMTAPALNNLISVNGYQNVSLTVVDSYVNVTQNVTTHSIDGAKIAKGSYIDWVTGPLGNASVDPKATQLVETSIDNGATWQAATLNQPIPNLAPGMKVASRSLQYRISLLLGTDPSLASFLGVSGTVYSSYNATKSDVVTTYTSQSDFNTGTYTDTMSPSGGHLTSNGFARNWDDANYSNQTTFGSSGQFVGIYIRQQLLKADAGADSRTRIDFAGNSWGNFTAEVDVKVTVNGNLGIEYFTTTWNNTLNSYAYNAFVTPTQVCLAKGGNGSNSFANVVTPVTVSFTDQSWHRLKVVVTGSVHDVFVDGIRYIHATDSTYGGPGYVALRFFNSSGTNGQSGFFDNFGIASALTGTWQSPSIDISGATTYGSSLVEWDATQIPNTTSVTAQTSIDGGSTWQSVTNGAAISGLTAGGSLSGKHLLIKMTLTASNASVLPVLSGITAWVMGQFNATGNRVSPALSLAAVGRAGASLVNWNVLLPTNTSIAVATSLDAGATYQSVAAAGNAITGITVQPSPTVDTFSANTSANYTQIRSSGAFSYVMRAFGSTLIRANSIWTWDTANSRLVANGGTDALLLRNSLTAADVDIIVDMDESDAGGIVWRWQDANNYYVLVVGDSLASSVATNQISLNKVLAGSSVAHGTATVKFPRNTPHRIRVTMLAGAITVYFDGTSTITYTDGSPFGTGSVGLYNATNTSRFYQLRIQPQGDDVTAKSVLTKVTLTSTDPASTPALLDIQTFVAGPTIGAGTLIPSANYQNTFVSSNIDDQKTQSNYWWLIDQNKKIQFQAQNAQPAPWIIASANASTQIGSQTIGDVLVDNLTLENSGDLYRNRETLTGVQDTAIFSKNFNGDGSSTSWSLDYAIADGSVPTITLNGQFQSVGVQGVDSGKQFYYQTGSTSITADGSVATLLDSDVLSVSYTGAFTTSITENNTGGYPGTVSQAQMAAIDGSSGINEDITDVTALNLNVAAATTYAQQLLQRYGVIGQTLTFKTLRQDLAAGQQLTVFVPEQSVVDVPFLVQSVETTAQQGQDANGNASIVYWYAVTALTGPNLGNWIKLFASGLK